MFKEYKQIDLETGVIIETYTLDNELDVPADYRESWGDSGFHSPIYDLENGCWKESLTSEQVEELEKEPVEAISIENRLEIMEEMLLFMMGMEVSENVE